MSTTTPARLALDAGTADRPARPKLKRSLGLSKATVLVIGNGSRRCLRAQCGHEHPLAPPRHRGHHDRRIRARARARRSALHVLPDPARPGRLTAEENRISTRGMRTLSTVRHGAS